MESSINLRIRFIKFFSLQLLLIEFWVLRLFSKEILTLGVHYSYLKGKYLFALSLNEDTAGFSLDLSSMLKLQIFESFLLVVK